MDVGLLGNDMVSPVEPVVMVMGRSTEASTDVAEDEDDDDDDDVVDDRDNNDGVEWMLAASVTCRC